jgi:hypothetical protein
VRLAAAIVLVSLGCGANSLSNRCRIATTETATPTTCRIQRGQCETGHAYKLDCDNGICICSRDAEQKKTIFAGEICSVQNEAQDEYFSRDCGFAD